MHLFNNKSVMKRIQQEKELLHTIRETPLEETNGEEEEIIKYSREGKKEKKGRGRWEGFPPNLL